MAEEHGLEFLNPPSLPKASGYSQVVVAAGSGRTIYVSGQVALDVEGKLVGAGDFEAQVEQVFKNLAAALAAAGTDFKSVVKLTYYLADSTNLEALRTVRARYVNGAKPPASAALIVKRLANKDWLVEIDAIAVAD